MLIACYQLLAKFLNILFSCDSRGGFVCFRRRETPARFVLNKIYVFFEFQISFGVSRESLSIFNKFLRYFSMLLAQELVCVGLIDFTATEPGLTF